MREILTNPDCFNWEMIRLTPIGWRPQSEHTWNSTKDDMAVGEFQLRMLLEG